MKKRIFIIFLCVALVQLAIPLSMIARREITLKKGAEYKFRVAPVDPYDAFRGRYVSIRLQGEEVLIPDDMDLERNQKIYVVLDKDQDGFARMTDILLVRPKNRDYFTTKLSYISQSETPGKKEVHVDIPFDRYYMEEELAPEAERAYQNTMQNAYITVRFLSGFGVIEQLYIEGKPVVEYLKGKNRCSIYE